MRNKIRIKPAEEEISIKEDDFKYVEGFPIFIYFNDIEGKEVILNGVSEPRFFFESLIRLQEDFKSKIYLGVGAESPLLFLTRERNEIDMICAELYLPKLVLSTGSIEKYYSINEILEKLAPFFHKFTEVRREKTEESINKWIAGFPRPSIKWTVKGEEKKLAKAIITLEFKPYQAKLPFLYYLKAVEEFGKDFYSRVKPKETAERWKKLHRFEESIKLAKVNFNKKI